MNGDNVLLILFALEIDDGVRIGDFLLLGDEICVHIGITECFFELLEGDLWESLGIRENGLDILLVAGKTKAWLETLYFLDVIHIFIIVSCFDHLPGSFIGHGLNLELFVVNSHAIDCALGRNMP